MDRNLDRSKIGAAAKKSPQFTGADIDNSARLYVFDQPAKTQRFWDATRRSSNTSDGRLTRAADHVAAAVADDRVRG